MALQRSGIVAMGARRVKAQPEQRVGRRSRLIPDQKYLLYIGTVNRKEHENSKWPKPGAITHYPCIKMKFVRIILQNGLSDNWY